MLKNVEHEGGFVKETIRHHCANYSISGGIDCAGMCTPPYSGYTRISHISESGYDVENQRLRIRQPD